MTPLRLAVLAGMLLLGGCGYFNSLYNAKRNFSTAERATRSGDRTTAAREYRAAIDRAAVSYRKYPNGRWADDALLLLGRARFELGEYEAAAAAMETLLEQSDDAQQRAVAHAYRGAALFMLEDLPAAIAHLDSAASALREDSEDGAFARLWRARTAFEQGRSEAGWQDLTAATSSRRMAHRIAMEGVRRSLQQRDSARAFEFMHHLARAPHEGGSQMRADSILDVLGREWSPSIAFGSSAPIGQSDWPADVRDAIALTRARLAVRAGDPDTGLAMAMQLGNTINLGIGSRARRLAAEIRLAKAESTDELEDVRSVLLPAYDDRPALELMRRVRAAQILLRNGQDAGSSISLFAAAELLRDEAGAPLLARRVFLDFAAQQPSIWAGKAALAAHQIAQSEETAAALVRLATNPYVSSVRGTTYDAAEIDRAEERLAYGIAGLRTDAIAEAIRRDVAVGRAVTVLDSTRLAARNDSVRIACGMLIDSLSVGGIRADSTRSACLRGDTTRVRFVLNADTVLLRDSTAGAGQRVPDRTAPDTVLAPPDTMLLSILTHR
ncbi:MAG: tetratricopeptide repeat protein [Gemmatimonadetes bacterium]|nr:tetratricopeptide repeat protein [Gemmatimonadota bacterium]